MNLCVLNSWNIGGSYFIAVYEINQFNLDVGVCVKKQIIIVYIYVSLFSTTDNFLNHVFLLWLFLLC